MFSQFYASGKSGSDWTKPLTVLLNLDLVETDKDFQIVGDIPGVHPDEIDLSLQDRAVIISVDRKEKYRENTDKLYLKERPFGTVHRRVELPKNADIENASSNYVDGVLTVVIPKVHGEAPPEHRKLTISQP